MLKREITYEDFNGSKVTETFYFNISKPELIEMQVEHDMGMAQFLQSIVESNNHKEVLKKFKEIVLLAYGEKSEDGKYFLKSDEIRNKFSQSAAYSSLFTELATNDDAAAIFIKGVLPQDMGEKPDQDKPVGPPKAVMPAPPTN